MEKISVVIPVYNAEPYLRYCLDSVISQCYEELEIILVDDGSNDKSGEICDAYAARDFRVHVIHKNNEGVSNARNAGIEAAHGKYIAFIDSDDYIVDDYFSKIGNMVKNSGNDCFVWWGYIKTAGYKKDGKSIKTYLVENELNNLMYNRKNILFLYLTWLVNSPCNKLYEKEILLKNGIRMNRELTLGEDLLFNLEYLDCIEEKKISILNEALYCYVTSGKESLSNKHYNDKLGIVKLLHENTIRYARKWDVTDGWGKFYDEYLYELCLTLDETFQRDRTKTYWRKLQEMNKEMQKKEFSDCLKYREKRWSRLMECAFRYRNYFLTRVSDKLEKSWKQ